MQTDIDAILEEIRSFRRLQKWSINKLATEAQLPWSILQNMDDAGWSPSLKTVRTLHALVRGNPVNAKKGGGGQSKTSKRRRTAEAGAVEARAS